MGSCDATKASEPTAASIAELTRQLTSVADWAAREPPALLHMETERRDLVKAAESVLSAVKPADPLTFTRLGLTQLTSIRLFIEWGVFDNILAEGTISYVELAAKVDAEVGPMKRLTTILVATNVLKQLGGTHLAHTRASAALVTDQPMSAMLMMNFDSHVPYLHAMPAYFHERGRKEPAGGEQAIHSFAFNTPNRTVWDTVNLESEKRRNFMSMSASRAYLRATDSYDFSWLVDKMPQAGDRALLVDVGGSKGHVLQTICAATPGLPMSRCVLEDVPLVLEDAKASAPSDLREAQFVAVDFHKEQPVKGALVYFVQRCLHDYLDDTCVGILSVLEAAMAEDSRLLIAEAVQGDPPTPITAANDLLMACIGGKERTLEGFESITSRARLRIACVHKTPHSDLAVIECVKQTA